MIRTTVVAPPFDPVHQPTHHAERLRALVAEAEACAPSDLEKFNADRRTLYIAAVMVDRAERRLIERDRPVLTVQDAVKLTALCAWVVLTALVILRQIIELVRSV
jgi:hypothetical protein